MESHKNQQNIFSEVFNINEWEGGLHLLVGVDLVCNEFYELVTWQSLDIIICIANIVVFVFAS